MGHGLPREGCEGRRARLWDRLSGGCDVVLITDPAHITYLSNFYSSPFEFRGNEAAAALILEPGKATLVGDNLLGVFLDEAFVDERVAPIWYQGKKSAPKRRANFTRALTETLTIALSRSGNRLGFEPSTAPAGVISAVSDGPTVDVEGTIRDLRIVKDPDEIALLRLSIDAIVAGFDAAREQVRPGMSEHEIFRLVNSACQACVGEPAIVYGDFVTGPRCEAVGGPPSDRILRAGELLLLDMSVIVRGYRGDLATTFAVGGPATTRQAELFQVCLDAMASGESHLRPGVACRDVDAAVRGTLRDAGLAGYNNSHAGHGLGLGHPESPFIVPESTDHLAAGQVVTLEPGVYVPGVGGMRIERNYLITPDGFETLSGHRLAIE